METIWPLFACLLVTLPTFTAVGQEADSDSRFASLFNGVDLDGWEGDLRFWRVEDGTIIGETTEEIKTKKNTFLIRSGEDYGDFELRFSYQVIGFNSGIQYRSKKLSEWVVKGYQADFEAPWHDDGKTDQFSGMFFEENGRMFLGKRGQAVVVRPANNENEKASVEVIGTLGSPEELEKKINREEWNEYTVIARGFQFIHIINGQVMSIAYDEDEEHRLASGKFAFQLHSGPPMQIKLKDIRVRRLTR